MNVKEIICEQKTVKDLQEIQYIREIQEIH